MTNGPSLPRTSPVLAMNSAHQDGWSPPFPSLLDGASLLGMVPASPPSPAGEEGLKQQGKGTHDCPGSEVEKERKRKENLSRHRHAAPLLLSKHPTSSPNPMRPPLLSSPDWEVLRPWGVGFRGRRLRSSSDRATETQTGASGH